MIVAGSVCAVANCLAVFLALYLAKSWRFIWQIREVVCAAHERPLTLDVVNSSPRELVECKNGFFYLSVNWFNNALALRV
jgi:hypothetical protein